MDTSMLALILVILPGLTLTWVIGWAIGLQHGREIERIAAQGRAADYRRTP